jgi:integrase
MARRARQITRRGRKYRNLTRSADGIWRFQMTNPETKERVRVSLGTRDLDEAVRMRDEILSGTGNFVKPKRGAAVRFAEMAQSYLEYDPRAQALARTTRHDRELLLRPGGRILRFFGDRALDEITPELLEQYWTEEVIEAGRKPNTGKQDLATIAAVLRYARKSKRTTADPCASFRAELSDGDTKAARAERDPTKDIRPVDVAALPALVLEARKESLRDLVYVLLMLDAGLRSGEALGLRWGHIQWGTDDERNSRKLWIEESRPRGGTPEAPKSGRRRSVGMSQRLRAALLEYRWERWNPSPEEHVLKGIDADNWSKREWRRITNRAGIHARRKDLRDTYASVLLSNGIPIAHISKQLGHATIAQTLRSYAKWCHGEDYVDPIRLSPLELPADLLARDFDQKMTREGEGGPR